MQKDHYYALLGVAPGCSLDQIKKAYKRCVKAWHPDQFAAHPTKHRQAEHKLKQINHAYGHLVASGQHRCGSPQAVEDTSVRPAQSRSTAAWLIKLQARIIQWGASLSCALQTSLRQAQEVKCKESAPSRRRAGRNGAGRPQALASCQRPNGFGHVLMRQLQTRRRDVTPMVERRAHSQRSCARIWMRLHDLRQRAGEYAERVEPVAGVGRIAK